METLHNHLIFFDAECPMCDMYTAAFVKTGILDANGRGAYQQLSIDACPMVDRQRATNEIALVNLETGEVSYGINSLFKIFATAMPTLKRLFAFMPFILLMERLYNFISYNRRIIIPVDQDNLKGLQPTFKLKYRITYLIFTWGITSLILTNYALLLDGMVPIDNNYREYLICGGQIFFQGIIISVVANSKRWDYLGNMMTISFAGAILLMPMIIAAKYLGTYPLLYIGYFLCIAGLMLLEHIRRSKLLHIGWLLSMGWAFYRVVILMIILLI